MRPESLTEIARPEPETARRAFLRGLVIGLPLVLMAVPFGVLFGVVATGAGLDIYQTIGFSVGALAGASQFTALQLMLDGAPLFVAVLAGLLVNMRLALYSASLAPYLGGLPLGKRAALAYLLLDHSYAASILDYERRPAESLSARFALFMGISLPMVLTWVGGTWMGAVLGNAIPASLPIDFVLPLAFLALIGPALRRLAHVAAALVSVVVALALVWMPWNLGLMVAAVAAMVTGARIDLWQARRAMPGTGREGA